MLDAGKIKAVTIDLDDTPVAHLARHRAGEKALHHWLTLHAPMAAALYSSPPALREIRDEMSRMRPDLKGDMSALRRESIRLALVPRRRGTRCWPRPPSRRSSPSASA
jgi:putative hydrolase of the HAD superfamily